MSKTQVTTGDIKDASLTDTDVAAANKDGVKSLASMRTLSASAPGAVGTAAAGSAQTASSSDHVHATGAGTPSTQAFGDAAAKGTGPAAAMTDHKHAMPANPVRAQAATNPPNVGTLGSNYGSSDHDARADHVHAIDPTFNMSSVTYYTPPSNAAFPGIATTNFHFFRTDLWMWFVYDGTRWISEQLFMQVLVNQPLGATVTVPAGSVGPVPYYLMGSDIWIEHLYTSFLINGGTALSGAHSWIGVLSKQPTGNTNTSVATVTINEGGSSIWRIDIQNIHALLDAGTHYFDFTQVWTKTGTPGPLYVAWYITYRIVMT